MKTRQWLIASAVLNLLLLAALATSFVAPSSGAPEGVQVGSAPAELLHVEKVLLGSGIDRTQARRAVYGIASSEQTEAPSYEYWKPAIARDAVERHHEYQRQQALRAKLMEAFGEEAKTDPAFSTAFRPYQRRLPMLSADQQLRLQQLAMEQSKAVIAPGSGPATAPGSSEAALAGELSPDARFEFSLRESGLSRALGSLGFDFTESEFREVFRALAAAHPDRVALPSSASFAGMLQEEAILKVIRSALGPQRFQEFARSRDPFFGLLRRIAVASGVQVESMDKAYALLTAAVDKRGPAASADTVDKKLVELLGPQVASQVARAHAFYRQSLRTPGPILSSAPSLEGRPYRIVPGRGNVQ